MTWLMMLACLAEPGEVLISGQILASQYATSGAADVTVASIDSELAPYSEAATDDNGIFEVAAVANRVYHLVLSGEGLAPTTFSGIIGSDDVELPESSLFVRSTAEVDALRAEFADCDSMTEDGGIIEGVIQFPITNSDSGENLIAEVAYAGAYSAEGVQYTACYLDSDGESLEAGAEVGATGRFAIFGVQPGAVTVEFSQDLGGQTLTNYGYVYMPEDGVGPFFPAFIDFPE